MSDPLLDCERLLGLSRPLLLSVVAAWRAHERSDSALPFGLAHLADWFTRDTWDNPRLPPPERAREREERRPRQLAKRALCAHLGRTGLTLADVLDFAGRLPCDLVALDDVRAITSHATHHELRARLLASWLLSFSLDARTSREALTLARNSLKETS